MIAAGARAAWLVLGGILAISGLAAAAAIGDADPSAVEIELVLPPGDVLTGYLRFEARLDGAADRVAFELDGKPIMRRNQPPYVLEIDVGHLPRRRLLRAVAYDAAGRVLAADERTLNGGPHRFAVRIERPLAAAGGSIAGDFEVRVAAEVPAGRHIERLELYRGDQPVVSLEQPPFRHRLAVADTAAPLVLRAVGVLDDGRIAEDAVVLGGAKAAAEVAVDLVELYVTVTDRADRLVTGLAAADFRVLENDAAIVPRRFERVEDLPIHATVLLDTSASMAPRIAAARQAVVRFFDQAVRSADDAVALVAFNDRPTLVAAYTSDREAFARALAGLGAARSTALFDSLVYALYYQGGLAGQRALLLVSDGADEISRFSLDDALEYAQRAQVTIYTVGLDLGGAGSRRTLERLAAETGGRSFWVAGADELDGVYSSVLGELRARYLLVYQSPSVGDGFRRIDVSVGGRGLRARAMRGYFP